MSRISDAILSRFDEATYLEGYPDVAAAVVAGACVSGLAHFHAYGFDEGRSPCPVSRRTRLLGGLEVAMLQGIEIGALANPAVAKNEGNVLYVDYADRDALVRRYATDPKVDVAKIVHVDAIWGEQRLSECLPAGLQADYVVASHVVEHVPDLLGWLGEIGEVLGARGQIRLAVPDRRYTFDILRQETQIHDVLDAYVRKARVPLPRAVLDFQIWCRTVKVRDAWSGQIDPETLKPVYQTGAAIAAARRVLETGVYLDTHCWVFTPRSFARIMEQAALAGLLGFECIGFHDTERFELEFFVALRATRDSELAASSWREMGRSAAGP